MRTTLSRPRPLMCSRESLYLELEELGGITVSLLLAGLDFDGEVLALDLPVDDELD